MEPNQNVPGVSRTRPVAQGAPRPTTRPVAQGAPRPTAQPVAEPAPAEAGPVFKDEPKKKNHATLLGMILLSLLAIGGIGFGVWAYLDGNQKVSSLNSQITDLKAQLSEQQTTNNTTNTADTETTTNPIIESSDDLLAYTQYFNESIDGTNPVRIVVLNGKIESCYLGNGSDNTCNINGLEGNIYKIVRFGAGQDGGYDNIGFIMEDGTVKYIPLLEAINNNDFTIKGSVDINGFVTDIFTIGAHPTQGVGGYETSVFVLKDGSYVVYDESMLQQN